MKYTALTRLMLKTSLDAQTGCWNWTGAQGHNGYGLTKHQGRMKNAHRAMHEEVRGPIAAGLHIDHLCRNRKCINPSHLEQVTPAENTRRSNTGLRERMKAFCPQGHPYSGANLYLRPDGLGRECRACHDARHKARKHKSP